MYDVTMLGWNSIEIEKRGGNFVFCLHFDYEIEGLDQDEMRVGVIETSFQEKKKRVNWNFHNEQWIIDEEKLKTTVLDDMKHFRLPETMSLVHEALHHVQGSSWEHLRIDTIEKGDYIPDYPNNRGLQDYDIRIDGYTHLIFKLLFRKNKVVECYVGIEDVEEGIQEYFPLRDIPHRNEMETYVKEKSNMRLDFIL